MKGLVIFGLFFSGVASIFLIAGWLMAESQRQALANGVPVQVKILESELEESVDTSRRSDGSRRSTRMYAPHVRFEYTVNGQRYESEEATPLDVSSSDSTGASDIVTKYRPGTTHTGYYDRGDPSNAFLVRQIDFFPYIFILFPLIHFCIGTAVIGMSLGARAVPRLETTGANRAVLKSPARDSAIITWLFGAGPWVVIGTLAFWHYRISLGSAGAAWEWWVWLVFAPWALLSLLFILGAWRAWKTSLHMGEARLAVSPFPHHDGAPVRVELQRDVRGSIDVKDIELSLIAKTPQNQQRHIESKEIAVAGDSLTTDRTLRGSTEFTLPNDRKADWLWTWRVRTRFGNGRKHDVSIPTQVDFESKKDVAPASPGDDITGKWPPSQES